MAESQADPTANQGRMVSAYHHCGALTHAQDNSSAHHGLQLRATKSSKQPNEKERPAFKQQRAILPKAAITGDYDQLALQKFQRADCAISTDAAILRLPIYLKSLGGTKQILMIGWLMAG